MITVDSTWMDFDIFKLHSSFLSSKSEKNPQWLLKFACKDSEFGGGGGGMGETNTIAGEICLPRGR